MGITTFHFQLFLVRHNNFFTRKSVDNFMLDSQSLQHMPANHSLLATLCHRIAISYSKTWALIPSTLRESNSTKSIQFDALTPKASRQKFIMRFCCNVLKNLGIIGIAMTLGNKFSFKLNLYFMRYIHTNTKYKP